jgi:hypothetical protein
MLLSIKGSGLSGQTFTDTIPHHLYQIEQRTRKGDKAAFIQLFSYVNDTAIVIDPLGYHTVYATMGDVALRLIQENSFFLKSEIDLDDTAARKFIKERLSELRDKIFFDDTIGAFLITPLQNRIVHYEVKNISPPDRVKIEKAKRPASEEWADKTALKQFVKKHDPYAMGLTALTMLKNRGRRNEYDFDKDKYTNEIALLTRITIGVPDRKGEITYHMGSLFDEYNIDLLNYATYWVDHYKDYKWNANKKHFENMVDPITEFPIEYKWYRQMEDRSDDTAIAAFIHLTEANVEVIKKLNKEFDESKRNYALRGFSKSFLVQLSDLNAYCKRHEIDLKGSIAVQRSLTILRNNNLAYYSRYALENALINDLSLSDITAVEYWSIVYESNWGVNYSTGKILDEFYSKNWEEIISDKKQLSLYLKKIILFEHLDIIGSCNHYACKFTGADQHTLGVLSEIKNEADDPDVKEAANNILTGAYRERIRLKKQQDSLWVAGLRKNEGENWPYNISNAPVINNLGDSLRKDLHLNSGKNIPDISYLATYQQLPVALKYLLKIDHPYWYIDRIIQGQFGVPVDQIKKRAGIDSFLHNYHRLNELELYKYYLSRAGINIWKSEGVPDYDKIYTELKYGYSLPFVGGGGINRDAGVFAVIKILEAQYGTKLGMPDKNEHWVGSTYHNFSGERRQKWMDFLLRNNIVTRDQRPPAFVDFN